MDNSDAKGKLKKLRKRALNGEINTIDNYKQCIASGIKGNVKVQIIIDKSLKYENHNLNITEIRDIILGIIQGRQLPRCIEIKNKCFIRNIFLLHFHDAVDPKKSLMSLHHDAPNNESYSVRISKNDIEDIIPLPYKLLTISNDQIDDITGNKNKKPKLKQNEVEISDNEKSVDEGNEPDINEVLEKYILSNGQMKAWNYPLKLEESVHKVDENIRELVTNRLQNEGSDCLNGLINGNLPTMSQSCELLLELINNNEMFTVADGDAKCNGFLQTYSKSSAIYSKLCSIISISEGDADADVNDSIGDNDSDEYHDEGSDELYSDDDNDEETLDIDIIAVDCEMCDTTNGIAITRLTLVDHNCKVILDTYIQPEAAITNHRTQWSGITEEKIKSVTVTLFQAQLAFMRIVNADTILVGHSLENDLRALKIIHNKCCDTAVMYPHSQGYPLRRKLKVIAEEYLGITIQSSDSGHNSVEDAAAAMELAILKMENGPEFGIPKNTFIPTRTSILPLLVDTNNVTNVSLYLESNDNLKLDEALHNPAGLNNINIMNYNNFDDLKSQYLSNKTDSNNEIVSNDGIKLIYISVNATDESVASIIDLLKQLESTTSLVIATSQCSLSDVKLLEQQKKTCLKNRQSTISWSRQEEEKLKNKRIQSNIGYMTYAILEN